MGTRRKRSRGFGVGDDDGRVGGGGVGVAGSWVDGGETGEAVVSNVGGGRFASEEGESTLSFRGSESDLVGLFSEDEEGRSQRVLVEERDASSRGEETHLVLAIAFHLHSLRSHNRHRLSRSNRRRTLGSWSSSHDRIPADAEPTLQRQRDSALRSRKKSTRSSGSLIRRSGSFG